MHDRLLLSMKRHALNNGDRVGSIFGYEVVHHRCLMMTTTTTTTTTSITPTTITLEKSEFGNLDHNMCFLQQRQQKQQQQKQRQRQQQRLRQRQTFIITPYPHLHSPSNFFVHHCSVINNHQHHQRFQFRSFDSRKVRKRKTKQNPFKVLKIKEGMLYKDVKAKFLKIAMSNHPDTQSSDDISEKEREKMKNIFIDGRIAFESLVENTDGTAVLATEKVDKEGNFDSWFRDETGLKNPFNLDIDAETMKEIAKATEEMGGDQGLDRDGGMWTLARMVTSAVKAGGDAASILRIESGDVKEHGKGGGVPGKLGRRKRKY